MKKNNFSIGEKYERIIIHYKKTRRILFSGKNIRKKNIELMTIDEAAKLSGKDTNQLRQDLLILRKENTRNKSQKH